MPSPGPSAHAPGPVHSQTNAVDAVDDFDLAPSILATTSEDVWRAEASWAPPLQQIRSNCRSGCLCRFVMNNGEEAENIHNKVQQLRSRVANSADLQPVDTQLRDLRSAQQRRAAAPDQRRSKLPPEFDMFIREICVSTEEQAPLLTYAAAHSSLPPRHNTLCIACDLLLFGVSSTYLYQHGSRSTLSRWREWGLATMQSRGRRQPLPPSNSCRRARPHSDETCIETDTGFSVLARLEITPKHEDGAMLCCSGRPCHGSSALECIGALDMMFANGKHGRLQGWHDRFNQQHCVKGRQRQIQRMVLGEMLHDKLCHSAVEKVLNKSNMRQRLTQLRADLHAAHGEHASLPPHCPMATLVARPPAGCLTPCVMQSHNG